VFNPAFLDKIPKPKICVKRGLGNKIKGCKSDKTGNKTESMDV
jgi:hypothetical protein